MTFATRTIIGMPLIPLVQDPHCGVGNTSAATGVRSGTITLNSDGTGSVSGSPSGATGTSGPYCSPTGVGAGNNFWVKMHVNSSNNTAITGAAQDTWIHLNGSSSWTFTNTSSSLEGFGTFTLTFALDSAGTQVVGTYASQTWDVGYTP